MVKIDFSICLHGSSPMVRNFTGTDTATLFRWLQPGEEWDGKAQPSYMTENTLPYCHKTYNGYLSSVFLPIAKSGNNLRSSASNPQPGYRNGANVVARSLIMLDFDALPVGSMLQVQEELDAENILGALYTTYNHMKADKGAQERFRAIIVTDRPMYAGEISRASYALFDMLRERLPFLSVDTASFNPAQAMYRPPANSQVYFFENGEPYGVDQLLDDFDDFHLQLPVKALTAGSWEPATPEDMERCEEWLDWADKNDLTVSDGQIWVCCPMHGRHSTGSKGDGSDGGAAILLPSARKGEATFKCLHSQCDADVNRNQHETMKAISDELDHPIPAHLLPDPHGGYGEQDRAAMRKMLGQEGGVKKRVRAEGAVDKKDLPKRIAGTFMVDVSDAAVSRLYELSKRFVYVVQGGQSRYYHRYVNPKSGKAQWSEWQIGTMRDALANEEGVVGFYQAGDNMKSKVVSLVDALHHWPGRITKAGGAAIFPPPTVCPPDMLNTWEGLAIDPAPGDVEPFKNYVLKVLCSGDRSLAKYFTQWLAHTVQHPGVKPGVAIVMRSGEGNGKGQLGKMLDRILGELFNQYNGTEKLTGQFNITLMTTLIAFIDEAKARGQENATIRGLVTESRALFEGKGSNQIRGQSFTRLIFASNENAMKVSKGDRRYCVLPLDSRYAANDDNPERDTFAIPFWRKYSDWANQDYVPAAVLHYLLNFDLTGFDEYNAPKTSAHAELVMENLSGLQEWLLWQAGAHKFPRGKVASRPDELAILPNDMARDYLAYAREAGIRDSRTQMAVKRELGTLLKRIQTRVDFGKSVPPEHRYGYVFATEDDFYQGLCGAIGVKADYDE